MHKFLANARNPINSFSSHSESHESGPNIIVKLTCENYRGYHLFFFYICISGFMFASALTLYVTVFLSSYSGATT